MLAEGPEIAHPGHRGGAGLDLRQLILLIDAAAVEKHVELTHLEAADFEVDLRGQVQDLEISRASASRSQAASSLMRLRAKRSARSSASDRSVRLTAGTSPSPSCRAASTSPRACNDPLLGVDQDRQHKPKPIEACRKFAHLLRRVPAGLSPEGLAVRDRDKPRRQVARDRVAVSACAVYADR